MRLVGALIVSILIALSAASQAAAQGAKPKPNPIAESYAAMPLAERVAIQTDLIWTGDYNGIPNGEFGERAIAAVKAFQARNNTKQTGVLNPQERATLAAAAKTKQDGVGWKLVDDPITGARLGIPLKLAPQAVSGKDGTKWSSQRGEVQVETFKAKATLQAIVDREKKQPAGRKVDYTVLRPDYFVLSGLQGLKKFYVRAHVKDGEVRGVTILYDQAMDGIMAPVVVAISGTYVPFGISAVADAPPPRKKVEYASGIVVDGAGHIVTDRQVLDGCYVVTVAGLGGADVVAEDKATELGLLRVYGAADLAPLALTAWRAGEASLIGVADPQAQGGAGAVSVVGAKLGGNGPARTVEPAPAAGFSGAAAVDAQGRLLGMVTLRASVVAGPPAGAQAGLVPSETIRTFLEANKVTPASAARTGTDAAKQGVVRVICVRK